MFANKNIIITGRTGSFGSELIKKLTFIKRGKQNKKDFLAILTKFMGDYNLRYNLSKFGQKEVDGLGTNRILKEIVKL
tara:strand:- start:248 stop:481 length:234 start_codon:yes stop_codon:yes gene_type:complete